MAGTTTPQDTYSDSAGVIPNTNPVVLDASGRLETDVYLGSTADYKEVLMAAGITSATLTPWPDDNIPAATGVFTGDSGAGGTSGLVPAPAAGDALANKFLKADGTWAVTPTGSGSGATDLSATETATTVSIASSTGAAAMIPAATSSLAGVLDSGRAAKIDGLATVATSGSYNDLSNTPTLGTLASLSSVDNANWSGIALAIGNGGTGQTTAADAFNVLSPMTVAGDMIVGGAGGSATRLGIGSSGQVLTVSGGVPEWTTPAGGSNGQLQFNNSGSLGGVTGSSWNGATLSLPNIALADTNSSSTGLLYKAGSVFLHTYYDPATNGRNLFFGTSCGNFTLAGAGQPTDASHNIGIGDFCLTNLTTGYFNWSMGWQANYSVTSGAGNVAIGGNANPACTVGFDNVAIADDALLVNQSSSCNVAVGHLAGASLISSGTFGKTTGQNTFIGYSADCVAGVATTLVNSTAIGAGSRLTKSNQMMFGTPSVTEYNFPGGSALFGGTIYANKAGANIRLYVDGTNSNDGIITSGGSGIFIANWALNRGITIDNSGNLNTIGSSTICVGGATPNASYGINVLGGGYISGTMLFGNAGANVRLHRDGTNGNDGALVVGAAGVYLSNWSLSRGILVTASGPLQVLGSGNGILFGGLNSAFPAIKPFSTTIQVRLADDSAFAPIQGKLTTHTAYSVGAPTATGYLTIYDSNGNAYKVLASQ